uniref:Late embryogenesis abundant protein LEA-2 subgroup domain-containing protein n=1 Tax=Kalanchoe fedtschenkoi TaxID=63787 RepID=A0A7N0URD0_KALFE
MAERNEQNQHQAHQGQSESGTVSGKAGTTQFIIKVPKDQIYKIPPPENAKRYADYTRRKPNRSSCCRRCILWTMFLILAAAVLAATAAGVVYLVFRPQVPRFTVEKISVSGFDSNLTASNSSPPIRLKFSLVVRAQNPNEKVSVYYERTSLVMIRHSEADLCDGELPYFRQPARNVTVMRAELSGAEIVSGGAVYDALVRDEKAGAVPLAVRIEAPQRLRFGNVKSWTFHVVVKCDVVVDELTEAARIVAGGCDSHVKIW